MSKEINLEDKIKKERRPHPYIWIPIYGIFKHFKDSCQGKPIHYDNKGVALWATAILLQGVYLTGAWAGMYGLMHLMK